MNMPDMESSNILARLMAQIDALAAQVQQLRSASGTLDSATIVDKNTGARLTFTSAQLKMWPDFAESPEVFSLFQTDWTASRMSRWYGPASDDLRAANSVSIQGSAPGAVGNFWVYTDGYASLNAGGNIILDAGDRVYVDAESSIDLVTPLLRLYDLPTTGAAPNLTLGYVGSDWTVATSVSSERYKTDAADVEVDVEDLLALTGITWVHNDAMDSSPEGPIGRNVGWSAERMDALPSLRQFVNYDEQGQPDSVEDARVAVAVHEFAKQTHARVVELEDAVTERDDTITALSTALARTPAHAMASTPVLALLATKDITVALDKPMPDTDYTVDLLLVGSAAGGAATVKSKTTTSVTVTLRAAVALGAGALLITARY